MKFGKKIKADLYSEWRDQYLDYNGLKTSLKQRTTDRAWTGEDEGDFMIALEQELDKIYQFQKRKTHELTERITAAEGIVKALVEEYEVSDELAEAHQAWRDEEAGDQHGYDDEDSDDESDTNSRFESSTSSLMDKFRGLEEEVATLVADVHDLALFTKLNFTGFVKIVKKHDKRTHLSLKTTFVHDFLEKRPFYKYNWDALIVKLSKLYDLVRTRGHPVQGDSSAGGSQSAFVRQTAKYWVHPDNLVHLKLAILQHLPVLVFNSQKEFEHKDAAITSIYFDNEDLDLYLGRLEKTEGAEAIRLRWYGDTNVQQIFVERKTHREDWTGEKSVKARFPIKENKVNAFLRGEHTMDAEFEQLITKGKKTAADVESMKRLSNEVQYAILTRGLQPVVRTFYNRTAFQLPGDARVRISLDTELTMVREDNWDGRMRSGPNWRRTDIGVVDWPFDNLEVGVEKTNFPYGVLEVKLQTQMGQEPPAWVTELVHSHLVEAVPKFSKFIHGCATLLPHRVDLVPFWLPQMDIDIRKPDSGTVHIDRPSGRGSLTGSQGASSHSLTPIDIDMEPPYTEPLSEGEDEEEGEFAIAADENRRVGFQEGEATEAIAFRKRHLADDNATREIHPITAKVPIEAHGELHPHPYERPHGLSIDPLAPAATFDEVLKNKLRNISASGSRKRGRRSPSDVSDENTAFEEEDRILTREWSAQPGKKIAVPVRVEPKVFFACERTFLMWLQFSILLGGIATTLLNFIDIDDEVGMISAIAFTLAALVAILYSATIFVYRIFKLRAREADGLYYDKYGPTLLCLVVVTALGTNVVLRVSDF